MLLMYKNRLQQYTQREHFGFPVYTTTVNGPPHDPQFKTTVIVNDKSYITSESFPTRKEAEQAAAKVACQALYLDGIQATTVTDESLYKNLLQEYAQKRGILCPTYQTAASGMPHKRVFVSTVEIDKHTFQGAEAKTKKQAEMHAAKVAYLTLSKATKSTEVLCMDECPVADDLSQNIQLTATTKKHQDTSYEDPYLNAKRMKPSTESMVVNAPPLSNSPSIVSNVIISEGEKSFSALPQVDNALCVPAHSVTDHTVENSEVQNSFLALPPVDNSSHVPLAHPIIEQTVKNDPVLPVNNTPPPKDFPSIASQVANSQAENLLPADVDPVTEQTVGNKPALGGNTSSPGNLPTIVSSVISSQVENPSPAPVHPVSEHTIQDKPLLQRTVKTVVFPRSMNYPIPEGATMMPFSDDRWVAYEIDQNSEAMV